MTSDQHEEFRDLCLRYGDFCRDVFLEEFRQWFVKSANKEELSRLRKSVQQRAKALRDLGRRRGRPRVQDDEDLLYKAWVVAWHRFVDGWKWPRIVKAEGLTPTKPNIRTVQRRCDYLAERVYRAVPGRADQKEQLERDLESRTIQMLIRSRTGLPFNTHAAECKKIVLKLAPRGLQVAASKDFMTGKNK